MLPVLREWGDEYAKTFTSAEVFGDAVREICQRHEISCQHVSAGYPGSCPVFTVDDAYVVKLVPPMLPGDQEREVFCYSRLAGRDSLVPELVAEGCLCDRIDWPYLVVRHVEGAAIRDIADLSE